MRKPLSNALREKVLHRDNDTCRYCGNPATCIDHVVPYSVTPLHEEDNLIAACGRCNSIAGSRHFPSFSEKKEFILESIVRRKARSERARRKLHPALHPPTQSPDLEKAELDRAVELIQLLGKIDARRKGLPAPSWTLSGGAS